VKSDPCDPYAKRDDDLLGCHRFCAAHPPERLRERIEGRLSMTAHTLNNWATKPENRGYILRAGMHFDSRVPMR
jgi:hypothetical protein